MERLAREVGISVNTVRNWEYGRTFVEDLGVIEPVLVASGIYIPSVLDEAFRNVRARQPKKPAPI
jgi:hypothetical protein